MLYSFLIMSTAVLYSIVETKFFGWNLLPQTPEELICDGIAICIASIGGATYFIMDKLKNV